MAFKGVVPAAGVKPAPFGLFSASDVQVKGAGDPHWGMGMDVMSEACSFNARLLDVCGAVPPGEVFRMDGDRFQRVKPFGIEAWDECLTVGYAAEDRRARVQRQLELVTQKAVERELWTGLYRSLVEDPDGEPAGGDYLASANASVVDPGAFKPTVALALLEQSLADCGPGYQGVIHMSPLTAAMFGGLLDSDTDGQLLTQSGNRVAVGTGYDGRGPGASSPEGKFVHWMYATGPVHVVLGAKALVTVDEVQATNVKTNEMTYVAQRPAAVYWDGCCHFAAKADVRL